MVYAIIGMNVFGFMTQAAIQTLVSNAADDSAQGRALGAVASLNSAMQVFAPVIGAGLLGLVSDLPRGDWRIGAPLYLCSALTLAAFVLAVRHFRRHPAFVPPSAPHAV